MNLEINKSSYPIKINDMKRLANTCILTLILLFFLGTANAQSNIIGNAIKIGNIEVAQYDFPDRMKWTDATTACNNLGFGWRLPTLDELGLIYKNISLVKNLQDPQLYYWSSNEVEGYRKNWFCRLSDGAELNISNYFTIGVRAVKTIKKDSEKYQINFVGIGNIDVLMKDLEVLNYYQAKQAIEDLGNGWRLPTENELQLMYNNQDKIGGLTRNRTYVGNQQVSSYLGGGFDKYYFELYTDAILAVDGKTFERKWSNDENKNKFYFYVRPVRNRTIYENKNVTTKKNIKNKVNSNTNDDNLINALVLNYQKQALSQAFSDDNLRNTLGKASKSSSSKSISSSKSSASNTAGKHIFKVTVTWNNPNCGSCPFPRPSAQNGSIDYFYERSGSYKVKPKCPICGKTQYNTIDGFTDNIGTSNQGSKVVTISCN